MNEKDWMPNHQDDTNIDRLPEEGMSKTKRPQADDKITKFIHHFAILNQHEHLCDIKPEEEDISQKRMQQSKHTSNDQQDK